MHPYRSIKNSTKAEAQYRVDQFRICFTFISTKRERESETTYGPWIYKCKWRTKKQGRLSRKWPTFHRLSQWPISGRSSSTTSTSCLRQASPQVSPSLSRSEAFSLLTAYRRRKLFQCWTSTDISEPFRLGFWVRTFFSNSQFGRVSKPSPNIIWEPIPGPIRVLGLPKPNGAALCSSFPINLNLLRLY